MVEAGEGAGGVAALLRRAAAVHPDCTLGLLLEGLDGYMSRRQNQEYRCLTSFSFSFACVVFLLSDLTEVSQSLTSTCPADKIRNTGCHASLFSPYICRFYAARTLLGPWTATCYTARTTTHARLMHCLIYLPSSGLHCSLPLHFS